MRETDHSSGRPSERRATGLRSAAAWLVAILPLACGARTEPDCAAATTELQRWIDETRERSPRLPVPDLAARLANHEGAPAPTRGLLIELTPQRLRIDGDELPPYDSPAAQELRDAHIGRAVADDPAAPLLLAIDVETPWARVLEVSDRAQETGARRLAFLFHDPRPRIPRPSPSAIDPSLDALGRDRSGAAATMTRLSLEVFDRCPPALDLSHDLEHSAPGEAEAALAQGLAPALRDCGCAADLASARALFWAVATSTDAAGQSAVVVDLVGDGAAILSAAPSTPWSTMAERLLAAQPADAPLVLRLAMTD
ncbi:MAG: hypothetical protein R3A79_31550 [Nannocystaceae bacterium]